MIGCIAGDVIGSVHEGAGTRTTDFDLFPPNAFFTDDTVMSVAVADHLLHGGGYTKAFHKWGNLYPNAGYGGMFYDWLVMRETKPYGSYGNGSAMRVSPIGYAFRTLEETLDEAKRSAEVSHNHPEGIKGAQSTAAAIFLARTGATKDEIRAYVAGAFGYDLNRTIETIRPSYQFCEDCPHTVPEAIIAFLDSGDFEHAIRLAISLGGDADTLACIAGAIAEAYYKEIPGSIIDETRRRLDNPLLEVIDEFEEIYGVLEE